MFHVISNVPSFWGLCAAVSVVTRGVQNFSDLLKLLLAPLISVDFWVMLASIFWQLEKLKKHFMLPSRALFFINEVESISFIPFDGDHLYWKKRGRLRWTDVATSELSRQGVFTIAHLVTPGGIWPRLECRIKIWMHERAICNVVSLCHHSVNYNQRHARVFLRF